MGGPPTGSPVVRYYPCLPRTGRDSWIRDWLLSRVVRECLDRRGRSDVPGFCLRHTGSTPCPCRGDRRKPCHGSPYRFGCAGAFGSRFDHAVVVARKLTNSQMRRPIFLAKSLLWAVGLALLTALLF